MQVQSAVITGATGAIGSALIKELVKHEVRVLVLTRKNSDRNQNIILHDFVKVEYCPLEDLSSFQNSGNESYDVFYHLAWAGTTGNGRNDETLQKKNVEYSLEAVRLAKRLGCKKFIGVGSQAEYGRTDSILRPDSICSPENEYGKAKLEAGIRTRKLAQELGLLHHWVRVLSVYGPNDNMNSLISYVIDSLKAAEVPELTAGEQIWDYLYSEDAAEALHLLGERGVDGKTYVLGSGLSKSLKEYIEEIRDLISPETELGFGKKPYPDKQVMYLKADISELCKDTGWTPKTSFAKGIQATAYGRID